MALTPEARRARGRIAALTRSRPADDPDLVDARLTLREERLVAAIEREVAAAPPLTPAQLSRLALLLAPRPQEEGTAA